MCSKRYDSNFCPIVGITSSFNADRQSYSLQRSYVDTIIENSGIPVIIPPQKRKRDIQKLFCQIDALLLPGGPDIDPVYFQEEPRYITKTLDPERDRLEIMLTRMALEENKPVLGICRGIQIINVAAGGDVYQDIEAQRSGTLLHEQKAPRWYPTHEIVIQPETILFQILRVPHLRVNSHHHQAVRKLAPGFRVSALANDRIIEAIEHTSLKFVLGVQWHPELMWRRYPLFKRVFTALIEASRTT